MLISVEFLARRKIKEMFQLRDALTSGSKTFYSLINMKYIVKYERNHRNFSLLILQVVY